MIARNVLGKQNVLIPQWKCLHHLKKYGVQKKGGIEEMKNVKDTFVSMLIVLCLIVSATFFFMWIAGMPALEPIDDPWDTWTSYEYTIVEVYVTCDEDEVPRVFHQCKGILMNNGRFIIRARVPNRNNSYIVARFNADAWCRIEERRIE